MSRVTTITVAVATGIEGDRTQLEIELTLGEKPAYHVDGVPCDFEDYMAVVETLKLGNPRPLELGEKAGSRG